MSILKIKNKKPIFTITGVTSSNVSSSLSGNMDLIKAQINEKNNDYINIKNAVRILEKYSNWDGYIKLYTEIESNFEVNDIVYITYTEDITESGVFNLENPSYPIKNIDEFKGFTFNDFYNGYKILYTNPYKNEVVINRYYNDIPAGNKLKYQYLSKVSCRGGYFFNNIADGVIFHKCNININLPTTTTTTTAISGSTTTTTTIVAPTTTTTVAPTTTTTTTIAPTTTTTTVAPTTTTTTTTVAPTTTTTTTIAPTTTTTLAPTTTTTTTIAPTTTTTTVSPTTTTTTTTTTTAASTTTTTTVAPTTTTTTIASTTTTTTVL